MAQHTDFRGGLRSVIAPLGASNHTEEERADNDFYATSPSSVEVLLNTLQKYNISVGAVLEPAVGMGHIADVLKSHNINVTSGDLVDRGYPETQVIDFFNVENIEEDDIITNPPYSFAAEFVEHSMELLKDDRYCMMLLKIQFLEGQKRKKLFEKYPPKYVWVFSERQKCLKNGKDEGGSSAVCYCWFIWQKGFEGKPMIDWI